MVTTNRVYAWKDGDRLFVDLNGATIEAQSLTFDRQVVTLRFHARVGRRVENRMRLTERDRRSAARRLMSGGSAPNL